MAATSAIDAKAGVPHGSGGRSRQRRTTAAAVLWLGVYLGAVTAPLLLLLLQTHGSGGGFAWDFAMALGYAGLAMLGVQFVLTARFRRATSPFGIDIVYYFHRYLAIAAVLLVLLHWLVLRLCEPAALGSAWPRSAPWHMSAGRLSLLLFLLVTLSSLLRRALRLDYDWWRITHAAFATLAFVLALGHVVASGRYLDSPWKRGLWLCYGAIWLAVIGYVRLWRPWRLSRRPFRVVAVEPERGAVWTLSFEAATGASLRFEPGQFVWLTLGSSPFAMREHPFSIASSAMRPERIELSIKELGDFTATMRHVVPGTTAYLDGCYGAFSVDRHPTAAGYVFVAGGIGVAPILSMLRTLADRSDQRPLLLYYGNRTWDRTAFREELERLQGRLSLRVVHVLLEPPPDWSGERGLIDRGLIERHLPAERSGLVCFACGPTPMIESVERSLAALGIPAEDVHVELFDWV